MCDMSEIVEWEKCARPGNIQVRSGTITAGCHSLHVGAVSQDRGDKEFYVTGNRVISF